MGGDDKQVIFLYGLTYTETIILSKQHKGSGTVHLEDVKINVKWSHQLMLALDTVKSHKVWSYKTTSFHILNAI